MPVVSLSNPLDYQTITNLYLFGQPTVPPIYSDRLRPQNSPTIVVNVDASFWDQGGAGRFASPALAPFVKTFFTDTANLPAPVQQLYGERFAAQGNVGAVRMTVADLQAAGVSASQFQFSFAQYGYAPDASDYAARTYIQQRKLFN